VVPDAAATAETETAEPQVAEADAVPAEASERDAGQAGGRPRVVEVVTEEGSPDPEREDADESGLPTAEVVRLPTAPQ
jgi:hypothetical protein